MHFSDRPPGNGVASRRVAASYEEQIPFRFEITPVDYEMPPLLEVVTHEGNHALMHHLFGQVPPWLNEGLSEYLERMQVFGQAVVIPPNPEWGALVKTKVGDRSVMPLSEYLALNQADWQPRNLAQNV
jgi:hypothetical protein